MLSLFAGCFVMRREKRQVRILLILFFFCLLLSALAGRLFYLQIIKGDQYAVEAAAQRTGTYVYASGRGQILDRDGFSLHTQIADSSDTALHKLAPYNIPSDLLTKLNIKEEIRYHTDSLASHVTGYIQRPRQPMRAQEGLAGLERSFNAELWGTPSAIGVILDARRKMVPGLGINQWQYQHYRRPYSVQTTIDRKLQECVETTGEKLIEKGAVVLLDPQSGDVLTLASFPRLPVELLYRGATKQELEAVEVNNPYLNRAIMQYPTGSVFKVIVAATALEEKLSEPEEPFHCHGAYVVGDRSIRCYGGVKHGVLNLQQALAVSCNGYFVNLAERLGKEKILNMARRFKLGQITKLPLGNEMAGNIPSASELPYPGDLANTAIGQGLVAATPVQLARMMAIIVNDGRDIYPRLVTRLIDKNGNTVQNFPVQYGTNVVSFSVARKLQAMLKTVVTQGSAQAAFSNLYMAAGKSGTAETGREGISHSWFAGFVEINRHKLVAVVFLEEWRGNQATASRIFGQIMTQIAQLYLENE